MPSQRPPVSRSRKNIFNVKTLHPLPQTPSSHAAIRKGPSRKYRNGPFHFGGKADAQPPHQLKVVGKVGVWGRNNPSSEGFSSPGSLPAYFLASGLASAFGAALSSAFGAAVMGSSLTGAKVTLVLSISAITSLVTSDLGSNASRLSAFIMTE